MSRATDHAEHGYQGWKNYETWAVALWINNEQGTHEAAHDMARGARKSAPTAPQVKSGIWTDKQAERFTLADDLKEWVSDDLLPDLGATLAADLLGAALSEVDWNELAESFLSDIEE